ncbi:pyridine nucleotide-disulfide oxidoreductase, partial [candidate division GN15 bacterium]|nr:pyridine nucleotide-disulfide oxidoreductase [candidate division GN15 bacterium]
YLSYASCGMPWLASGDLEGPEALLQTAWRTVRDSEFFHKTKRFESRTGTEVIEIDREARTITVRDSSGQTEQHGYGTLVLATGAHAAAAPFPAPESPLIKPFHSLADAIHFRQLAERGQVGQAVIVGGGFIGMELLESLGDLWGIEQTLVEAEDRLLPYVLDREMSDIVLRHVIGKGVTVHRNSTVERIDLNDDGKPVVTVTGVGQIETDYVFTCLGARPNVALAESCGLEIGPTGAIVVDQHMRTSDPNVYAGGDCVESVNLVSGERFYLPMGSLANKHGRVIAENIAGNEATFKGALGAFVVKVFDLNVGTVGLNERVIEPAGIDHDAVWGTFSDRPTYYLEHEDITCKLLYERTTNRLLGLQAVGKGDICRRVDVTSAFLLQRATVGDLIDHEHGYAPPYSEPLDPLYHLACMAEAKARGVTFLPPSWEQALNAGDVLLDVREPDEVDSEPLKLPETISGVETVAIPIGDLKLRLGELDRSRPIRTLCARGPRSYQAAITLQQAGFTDVAVVTGGLLPYLI